MKTNNNGASEMVPVVRVVQPHENLHWCLIPYGYFAPLGFPKLFRQSMYIGSRADALRDFSKIVDSTIVVCGRCGHFARGGLWSERELEHLYDYGMIGDPSLFKRAVLASFHQLRLTCSYCGLEASPASVRFENELADGF